MARTAIDAFFAGAVDGNHPPVGAGRFARRRSFGRRRPPVVLAGGFCPKALDRSLY